MKPTNIFLMILRNVESALLLNTGLAVSTYMFKRKTILSI